MFCVLLGRGKSFVISGWPESAKSITYVSDMNIRDLLAVSISSSFNEKRFKRACHLFLLGQQTRLNLVLLWGNPQELFFCHAIHNVHDLLAESIGFFHGGCFRIYANDRFSV